MKKSILIVDDEFGLADVVADVLIDLGYEVEIAINGRLALDRLAARSTDLVLSDVMMPVMDGPELIRAMRADPRFMRIPVVLMSALPESIPSREDVGYDATLVKPFLLHELLALIKNLLERDRS